VRGTLALAALLVCAGCAPRKAAPSAGVSRGRIPDLVGTSVVVIPVQSNRGIPGDPTAELADALRARGRGVHWFMPDTLRIALARSPALGVPLDAIPVEVFLHAQVNRLGDPAFGFLRRLNALTNARMALVPVEVRHRTDPGGGPGVDEYVCALVNAENGYVAWFGVTAGEPGEASSPRALASAADAVARRLFPGL
jgi:hypothetical protein